jgi:hypothetical protein
MSKTIGSAVCRAESLEKSLDNGQTATLARRLRQENCSTPAKDRFVANWQRLGAA